MFHSTTFQFPYIMILLMAAALVTKYAMNSTKEEPGNAVFAICFTVKGM